MTNKILVAIWLTALLVAAVVVFGAYAEPEFPVEIFELRNTGRICVIFPDGSGDCYCPCEVNCANIEVLPNDNGGNTPEPKDTPMPTERPTQVAKCNRGIGNDSEGCDPGNSSGQGQGQGRQAGEDRNEKKKDK